MTGIVDASGRALTRRLLSFFCDGYQRLDGETLRGPSRGAGLTEIVVESVTVLLTDLSRANAVVALEDTVTRAGAAGVVTEAAASAWIDALCNASKAGQVFAARSGVMVAGRNP